MLRNLILGFLLVFSALAAAYDYDVIVIGAGPAGLSAAISAAGEGASVLVVEKREEEKWATRDRNVVVDREAMNRLAETAQVSRPFAPLSHYEVFTEGGLVSMPAGSTADAGFSLIVNRNFGGSIPINGIERSLKGVAKDRQIDFSFTANAVEIEPHLVRLQTQDGVKSLTSKFTVLATGSKSGLLEKFGFFRRGLGFAQTEWLVANFDNEMKNASKYVIDFRASGTHPYYGLAIAYPGTTTVYMSPYHGSFRGSGDEALIRSAAKRLQITGNYRGDVAKFIVAPDSMNKFSDPAAGVLVVGDAARRGDPVAGLGISLAIYDSLRLRRFFHRALDAKPEDIPRMMRSFDREMKGSVELMVTQMRKFDSIRDFIRSKNPILKLGVSAVARAASFFAHLVQGPHQQVAECKERVVDLK